MAAGEELNNFAADREAVHGRPLLCISRSSLLQRSSASPDLVCYSTDLSSSLGSSMPTGDELNSFVADQEAVHGRPLLYISRSSLLQRFFASPNLVCCSIALSSSLGSSMAADEELNNLATDREAIHGRPLVCISRSGLLQRPSESRDLVCYLTTLSSNLGSSMAASNELHSFAADHGGHVGAMVQGSGGGGGLGSGDSRAQAERRWKVDGKREKNYIFFISMSKSN